jgi:hypothetical protein
MSLGDTIGYQNDVPTCAVCGKNVEGDRGFARINHGSVMLNLCCPLCLDTFQHDPEPYLAKLAKIEFYRELKRAERGTGDSPAG